MHIKRYLSIVAMTLTLILLSISPATATKYVIFDNHDLTINMDVPNHTATVFDTGTVNVFNGWNLFVLGGNIDIDKFRINGEIVEKMAVPMADTAMLPTKVRRDMPEIDASGESMLVLFHWNEDQPVEFALKCSGEFFQDVADTRFSNENVGGEITATIGDQGAYFSAAAGYYAEGGEDMANFKVTVEIPQEWESISDGNLLASDSADGRKVQSWENPFQSDGVTVFAAPFIIKSMMADSTEVFCYFFAEDTLLIENYLTATADYIKMYNELIGPYPYQRFTVAENFWPTGYGMPGWTLLGQQVLRLPFIISTSLGHEVLHNWWGNSVFVDYERGNWCEGITVYGADYRYKLQQSPTAALDYRKNILKQYVSYVNEGNDFPLREFKSRTSPETRTVGYNKAMMVFHMIEELIGPEAFFQAWKDVYAQYRGQKVNWDQWMAAFENTSKADLKHIRPQWIDRTGAPVIAAEIIETVDEGEARKVKFNLAEQSGFRYHLQVPLRFSGADPVLDTSVTLDTGKKDYELSVPAGATTLEIDPDYHLFRKLYPEEVEPVIAAVLGNPKKQFVLNYSRIEANHAFREFGLNMTGDSISFTGPEDEDTTGASYGVFLGRVTDYVEKSVVRTPDTIYVAGTGYDVGKHTFVFAGQDEGHFGKYITILTNDFESLPRIGQLIPHYGKYSYLVFEGARNVGKGQWVPDNSPLKLDLARGEASEQN